MIEVDRLTKTFPATRRTAPKDAVRDVSFRCVPGEVYALLGPNGAGKTSTLRVIATTLRPTSGTVRVQGHDVVAEPRAVGASIGFLTGNTAPYGRLTAREVVAYFARLYGVPEERIAPRIAALAHSLQMEEFVERRCDKLSMGQKQKVSIARTIVHDPPVLILDEPTAGLDVLAARAILDLIRDCRARGKTVLFSTHVMTEAEKLADRVGILFEGRLVREGTAAELLAATGASDLEGAFLRCVGAEGPDGKAVAVPA
jgi:sodium transport system ATP-binding protein